MKAPPSAPLLSDRDFFPDWMMRKHPVLRGASENVYFVYLSQLDRIRMREPQKAGAAWWGMLGPLCMICAILLLAMSYKMVFFLNYILFYFCILHWPGFTMLTLSGALYFLDRHNSDLWMSGMTGSEIIKSRFLLVNWFVSGVILKPAAITYLMVHLALCVVLFPPLGAFALYSAIGGVVGVLSFYYGIMRLAPALAHDMVTISTLERWFYLTKDTNQKVSPKIAAWIKRTKKMHSRNTAVLVFGSLIIIPPMVIASQAYYSTHVTLIGFFPLEYMRRMYIGTMGLIPVFLAVGVFSLFVKSFSRERLEKLNPLADMFFDSLGRNLALNFHERKPSFLFSFARLLARE